MIVAQIKLVDALQASRELGVHRSRIYQLLNQGRIRGAQRIGTTWVMPSPLVIESRAKGPDGCWEGHRGA